MTITIKQPDLRPLLAKFEQIADIETMLRDSLEDIDERFCAVQTEYYDSLGGRYVDTGNLKASLTRPSHPDHVAAVSSSGVTLGTTVDYAQYLGPDEVVRLDNRDVVYIVGEPVMQRIERIWGAS